MIKFILTINNDNYIIYEKQNLNEEIEELEQEVESLENEISHLYRKLTEKIKL